MQTTPTPRHIPDLLKLLLYVMAVMLGGALLAPWLVHAGMAAFPASEIEAGGASGWLAEKIHGAPFARFFSRASQFWAVLLLWPLIRWAGMDRTLFPSMRPAGSGVRDYALGFALAAGLLLALGWGLCELGIFRLRPEPAWGKIGTPLTAALGAGILEELFFRGALLGLLLRTMAPLSAAFGTTFLFAIVHFLRPPEGWVLPMDEVTWTSGFTVLRVIAGGFADVQFLLAEFATLFAVGWVLCMARLKTGRLWASMGLHGGWVFGLKYFSALTLSSKALRAGDHLPWIGLNLKIGLAPLLVIALTGWLFALCLRSAKSKPVG
jgi:membrane protease YdiL (CAAX protease family)